MKKIGIIGGVSWLSTVEYYKAICQLSHEYQYNKILNGPMAIPEMTIESLNINKSFNLRGAADDEASWCAYEAYFQKALKRLESSGADFAIIASNTPHNRYDSIVKGIGIPVLNIFEEVAKVCSKHDVGSALILGTAPTMASPVFSSVLNQHGVLGKVPKTQHDKTMIINLIDELQAGKNPRATELIQGLVKKYLPADTKKQQAVCLSCTELPLAFTEFADAPTFEIDEVLYINTTIIHAKAAFEYALASN
jgi:aspartate racemase